MSLLEMSSATRESNAAWVSQDMTSDTVVTATTNTGELFRVTLRRTPSREGSDAFWV
jgi:hypothetical protein